MERLQLEVDAELLRKVNPFDSYSLLMSVSTHPEEDFLSAFRSWSEFDGIGYQQIFGNFNAITSKMTTVSLTMIRELFDRIDLTVVHEVNLHNS